MILSLQTSSDIYASMGDQTEAEGDQSSSSFQGKKKFFRVTKYPLEKNKET